MLGQGVATVTLYSRKPIQHRTRCHLGTNSSLFNVTTLVKTQLEHISMFKQNCNSWSVILGTVLLNNLHKTVTADL